MKLNRISFESFDEQIEDFNTSKSCISFSFSTDDKNKEDFHIILAPIDDKYYETHSSDLSIDKRGVGFGVFAYSTVFQYCLDNQIHLCSSSHRSESSERLWKSKRLNEIFSIEKKEKRYVLLKSKQINGD